MSSVKSASYDFSNYLDDGFIKLTNVINQACIDLLLDQFTQMVNTESNNKFKHAHDDSLCQFLTKNRSFQSFVYDAIRKKSYLQDFVLSCGVIEAVKLICPKVFLLDKIIFRIDQPLETSEIAVWHQDHYYVKGSQNIITAWIPLQNVNYFNGCLSVMPKSHLLGPLAHDYNVLSKKFSPTGIYKREVRYAELCTQDCLLFHSLLLHSGNLNVSNQTRYSIQARFVPEGEASDPEMGSRTLV